MGDKKTLLLAWQSSKQLLLALYIFEKVKKKVDKGYLADTIYWNFQQFLTNGFYES